MKLVVPFLAVVLGAIVAAIKLLPWWGAVGVVLGLLVTAKYAAGYLLKRVVLGAFKAKSAALQGAWATLHGVSQAEAPKPDEDDDDFEMMETEGPCKWVHLDMTIHVPEDNAGKTPFRLWDPGELSIVPLDAKPGMDFDEDEDLGMVAGIDVQENGRWVTCEDKLEGTRRIRIHAGVKPDVDTFKLRYYFEILSNTPPA